MLDRGIRKEIERNGLRYLVDDISPVFKSADYGIVNLECPIGLISTPLTKQFVFLGDPNTLPELKTAGITHGIMANNHSYDHGREAMIRTADHLLSNNIIPVGYGETQKKSCDPVLFRKGNIEVGLFSSVTLGLESWMYLEDVPGMCQASIGDLETTIMNFKREKPNSIVIVTLHWGAEYQNNPTSIQRKQAKILIEAGADAIIGHHPHVVQSYESVMGKPVFYSIGNLIFDNKNPLTHDGILVKINVDNNGELSSEIIPYHAENYKPLIMNDEQKLDFMTNLQKRSDPLP